MKSNVAVRVVGVVFSLLLIGIVGWIAMLSITGESGSLVSDPDSVVSPSPVPAVTPPVVSSSSVSPSTESPSGDPFPEESSSDPSPDSSSPVVSSPSPVVSSESSSPESPSPVSASPSEPPFHNLTVSQELKGRIDEVMAAAQPKGLSGEFVTKEVNTITTKGKGKSALQSLNSTVLFNPDGTLYGEDTHVRSGTLNVVSSTFFCVASDECFTVGDDGKYHRFTGGIPGDGDFYGFYKGSTNNLSVGSIGEWQVIKVSGADIVKSLDQYGRVMYSYSSAGTYLGDPRTTQVTWTFPTDYEFKITVVQDTMHPKAYPDPYSVHTERTITYRTVEKYHPVVRPEPNEVYLG